MIKQQTASSQKKVLAIGAAGLDITGRLKNPPAPGTSSPAQVRPSFGGVAHNVALNLARLGQPVSLITAVGNDFIGRHLLADAAEAGVDVSASLQVEGHNTATYLAVLDTSGLLQFALDDMRTLSALKSDVIRQNAALFEDCAMVFVDANLPPTSLRTVISLARKAQVPVCADPTSTSLAGRLLPYLSSLYMVTPNLAEARILCGCEADESNPMDGLQAARYLVNHGVSTTIIQMAESGVIYASSETNGHIPAIQTTILDPTGAGAALTATVIFGLLNDIPLDESVRMGVSAASLTLRYPGSCLPDLSLEMLYDQLVI
jgi:pseudouridine kinase